MASQSRSSGGQAAQYNKAQTIFVGNLPFDIAVSGYIPAQLSLPILSSDVSKEADSKLQHMEPSQIPKLLRGQRYLQ